MTLVIVYEIRNQALSFQKIYGRGLLGGIYSLVKFSTLLGLEKHAFYFSVCFPFVVIAMIVNLQMDNVKENENKCFSYDT